MTKCSDLEAQKKREKIQVRFWIVVGEVEHINIPKLEDALKKEFNTTDYRFVQSQIKLMQTEARVRIQGKEKVWIKEPFNF
jgi:hypothetical protein